jgi:hypothetical protein
MFASETLTTQAVYDNGVFLHFACGVKSPYDKYTVKNLADQLSREQINDIALQLHMIVQSYINGKKM